MSIGRRTRRRRHRRRRVETLRRRCRLPPAFVTPATRELATRARHETTALLDAAEHHDDTARTIADRIRRHGQPRTRARTVSSAVV
jgi:hypothetical protein